MRTLVVMFFSSYGYSTSFTWSARPISLHSSGPWFNIKKSLYQYRKSCCRDKTIVHVFSRMLMIVHLHNDKPTLSYVQHVPYMMTLWHAFCVTGPLWGESTRRFPSQRVSCKCGLLVFLWCWPEQTVERTLELSVIWDIEKLIGHHCDEDIMCRTFFVVLRAKNYVIVTYLLRNVIPQI